MVGPSASGGVIDQPGRARATHRCVVVAAAVIALASASPCATRAQGLPPDEPRGTPTQEQKETPTDGADKPWWEWPRATGDWGGTRTWLEDHGLTLDATYTADFWVNTRGGRSTSGACAYLGLVDVALTFDTEKAGLWDGGIIFIDFQDIHGSTISERHVGDLQFLDNIEGPDRTQVSEYWYRQSLLDGKLAFKLGKMDANSDFAYVDYGQEFIHSSPGFPPNIPLPTYPDPALGAVLFIEPVEWCYLNAGVYDGAGTGNRWDWEAAFHGPDDSFTIVELGLRPTFTLGSQRLPGTYRVGGWYHSGSWDLLATGQEPETPLRRRRGNTGVYVAIDQQLLLEQPDDDQDRQGLGMFFQFSWADSRHNEISQYYGGGFEYVGLLPTRDRDVTGIGMFHGSLSGRLQSAEQRYSETAIELFHRFQVTPCLVVKPDLQYIVNPGGGDTRDALVAGVRVEMSF